MSVTTLGQTGSSNALYILNSNGNVGIGKSNPSYALDVLGDINYSGTLRSNGALVAMGLTSQDMTEYVIQGSTTWGNTVSGTWNIPTGVRRIKIQMVGPGGAGYGYPTNTSPYASGGGGGAGGYLEAIIDSSLASSLTYSTVTQANGTGTMTLTYNGNTFSCTPGYSAVGNSFNPGLGGSGGSGVLPASGYLQGFVSAGGDGGCGTNVMNGVNTAAGGTGGASYFGSGGKGGYNGAGTTGSAWGSGGGGASVTYSGGNGAPGVIIISYMNPNGVPNTYTASAPLSMTGTTLTIAAAASNAVGVIQPDNITTAVSAAGVLAAAAPFRNRVYNGNMIIDQRNTATTAITTNASYAMDRFILAMGLTSGSVALSQAATPATLTGFTKCAKLVGSSINVSGSYNYVSINQIIEGQNIADLMWGTSSAQPVTLSFWVYCTATGTYSAGVRNNGATRSYQSSYTITAANTWQQVVIPIPGDTTGTWPTDNTGSLHVYISFASHSSLATTAGSWAAGNYIAVTGMSNLGSNTAYVTGVQLEKGSIATPFEYRPPSVELQLCQRYFVRFGSSSGSDYCIAAGHMREAYSCDALVALPVTMRVSPTFTLSGTLVVYSGGSSSAVSGVATLGSANANQSSVAIRFTGSAACTTGNGAIVVSQNGFLNLSSEL